MLGTWALSAGDLTLGGLLAFLAYLAQLYRPMRDLSRARPDACSRPPAGAERVIELLDTRARGDRAPRRARRSSRVRGQLELDARHLHATRAPRARRSTA